MHCREVAVAAIDHETAWVVDAYERYFKYVWALVGRLGVPAAGIEDTVQDVFLVLHRRRQEFRGSSTTRTWLHGITVNVARRHRERARRRAMVPVEREPLATDPSPEAVAADRARLEQLDRLLGTLGDEQREVFVLTEIAELSAPEIAQILELKLNTVYSRLRLARRHLAEGLATLRDGGTKHGAA